jgi:hypothetical protein
MLVAMYVRCATFSHTDASTWDAWHAVYGEMFEHKQLVFSWCMTNALGSRFACCFQTDIQPDLIENRGPPASSGSELSDPPSWCVPPMTTRVLLPLCTTVGLEGLPLDRELIGPCPCC